VKATARRGLGSVERDESVLVRRKPDRGGDVKLCRCSATDKKGIQGRIGWGSGVAVGDCLEYIVCGASLRSRVSVCSIICIIVFFVIGVTSSTVRGQGRVHSRVPLSSSVSSTTRH
jgi:hypothetical protein